MPQGDRIVCTSVCWVRLTAALLTVAFGAVSCGSPRVSLAAQAPATLDQEPAGYEEGVVVRAIDGDTIEVRITARVPGPGAGTTKVGQIVGVRLLGIDTPESVDPNSPVECFGQEASAATEVLLEGRTVRLVKDVEDEDSFGRQLRYVYIGHEMVNARLVVNGYASTLTYPPNVRHAALFSHLQRDARTRQRGLWDDGTCGR
jgi:micrococcal nuclease